MNTDTIRGYNMNCMKLYIDTEQYELYEIAPIIYNPTSYYERKGEK